jgi:hypothetical protein
MAGNNTQADNIWINSFVARGLQCFGVSHQAFTSMGNDRVVTGGAIERGPIALLRIKNDSAYIV